MLTPEDLQKEAEEISTLPEEKRFFSRPVLMLISFAMIFLLLFLVVPYYAVQLDPRPAQRVSLSSIPLAFDAENVTVSTRNHYPLLVTPQDPDVKYVADTIITRACTQYHSVCYAKALFYFVRDEMRYVSDPRSFEYVKGPKRSLLSGGGDCDDASVLLVNLLEAVGIKTRFVFIPGHVYVEAYLPDARAAYRQGNWVPLDSTCYSCSFGELPYKSLDEKRQYLFI